MVVFSLGGVLNNTNAWRGLFVRSFCHFEHLDDGQAGPTRPGSFAELPDDLGARQTNARP
jgi:hypothetical protein